MSLSWPTKDPDEVLDYTIDWLPRLGDDDTIALSVWTVPGGLAQTNSTNTDTETVVWLSGGTIGTTYSVQNRITTVGGRTMDQTVTITIATK